MLLLVCWIVFVWFVSGGVVEFEKVMCEVCKCYEGGFGMGGEVDVLLVLVWVYLDFDWLFVSGEFVYWVE